MISVSFCTLVAIKTSCPSLRDLELYVYEITSGSSTPLEQAVMEAPAGKLEDLVSLQLGGTIPSGEYLENNLEWHCEFLDKKFLFSFIYRRNHEVSSIWMPKTENSQLHLLQLHINDLYQHCHQRHAGHKPLQGIGDFLLWKMLPPWSHLLLPAEQITQHQIHWKHGGMVHGYGSNIKNQRVSKSQQYWCWYWLTQA